MGAKEAEAVKLFANTYLAMRVGCLTNWTVSADLWVVDRGGHQWRLSRAEDRLVANNPSFGYGGYCFPKDTKQMVANFDNIPQALISAVVATNTARWDFLLLDKFSRIHPVP